MWDERYAGEDYVFGTEPNAFLKARAAMIPAGSRVLAVADGEGRNGVFLAREGHDVVTTDFSPNAIAKAQRLAAAQGVSIDTRLADLTDYDWDAESFDAVVAIFIQFAAPPVRNDILEGIKRAVKPGGLILLQGYRPEQLEYGTGGPPAAENMYTPEFLEEMFQGWDPLHFESHDSEIQEGQGHGGMSALIDLVAKKPG